MMADDWQERTLGEFASIQTGPFGSQLHASDYVADGIPSIMPKNIGNRLDLNTDDIARINNKDAERLSKYLVRPTDIVYSRRGDVEKCAFITEEHNGWLCGTGCIRVRFTSDEVDPFYIALALSTSEVRGWISGNAVGTIMPNLNTGILERVPLSIPPVNEQRLIANAISSLDDKIGLLHRQNKTIEALTNALYRRCFEDSLHKANWPLKRISEVVDHIQYGFTQSATSEALGPKFLRITDIQGGSVNWDSVPYCIASDNEIAKYSLCHGDIVIARTGASTGENFYCYKPPCAVFASYLIRVQCSKLEVSRYIAMNTRSCAYFDYIEGILSGSAQPNANAQELTTFEIALPPRELLHSFLQAVDPMDEKRHANTIQIRTLEKLRDTLLPKLMSGEVRVQYE